MFAKNKIIIHERSMDVCYQVLSSYVGSETIKLKVYMMNMGFNRSWQIFPRTSWIEIKKTDLRNWSALLDTHNNACYRNCKRIAV